MVDHTNRALGHIVCTKLVYKLQSKYIAAALDMDTAAFCRVLNTEQNPRTIDPRKASAFHQDHPLLDVLMFGSNQGVVGQISFPNSAAALAVAEVAEEALKNPTASNSMKWTSHRLASAALLTVAFEYTFEEETGYVGLTASSTLASRALRHFEALPDLVPDRYRNIVTQGVRLNELGLAMMHEFSTDGTIQPDSVALQGYRELFGELADTGVQVAADSELPPSVLVTRLMTLYAGASLFECCVLAGLNAEGLECHGRLSAYFDQDVRSVNLALLSLAWPHLTSAYVALLPEPERAAPKKKKTKAVAIAA